MLSIAAKRIMMMASLALVLGWTGAAVAAKPESEASVVARLYKDFAWQGICHLDVDLLFDSQDPRVIDLDVQTVASGKVSVAFKDPVTDEQKRIAFHLTHVGGKWKIADIRYGNEGQPSLLKVLSRKDP